jgi:hypothetical protein
MWTERGYLEAADRAGGQRHHGSILPKTLEAPGQVQRSGLGAAAIGGRNHVQNACGFPISCHHGGPTYNRIRRNCA